MSIYIDMLKSIKWNEVLRRLSDGINLDNPSIQHLEEVQQLRADIEVARSEKRIELLEHQIRVELLRAREKLLTQRLDEVTSLVKSLCDMQYDQQLSYLDVLTIAGKEPMVLASRHIPSHIAREVWERDGGTCVICGSPSELHYDHIIPLSKGGSTTADNLQLLCKSHNLSKGARI